MRQIIRHALSSNIPFGSIWARKGYLFMFKIGSKVVYPAHGIGIIEGIEEKAIGGMTQQFYMIRILDNGMVIIVPKSNILNVGIREVIKRKDVTKVIDILKESPANGDTFKEENWNRRHREYIDRIKTGSVYEIAKVYRKLFFLKSHKELSFGERQVFDNMHQLIVSEIALAKGIGEDNAEKIVAGALVH